mgnify:CR=1 FL=1
MLSEQKAKAYRYMRGWRFGADGDNFPNGFDKDDDQDFRAGYEQGRLDKKQASIDCQIKYGVEFKAADMLRKED